MPPSRRSGSGAVRRPLYWESVLLTGSESMQRTAGALRSRFWARMLASRLFPTPPLPCSERWTLPAALISIPSFGAKVRFLLSDQFLFVRGAAVVFEARPAGQAVPQVRQWIVGRDFGGSGGGIRRWDAQRRARRHAGRRRDGGHHEAVDNRLERVGFP